MKFCFIFTVHEGVACVMCMLDWVMFPISSAWKVAFLALPTLGKFAVYKLFILFHLSVLSA